MSGLGFLLSCMQQQYKFAPHRQESSWLLFCSVLLRYKWKQPEGHAKPSLSPGEGAAVLALGAIVCAAQHAFADVVGVSQGRGCRHDKAVLAGDGVACCARVRVAGLARALQRPAMSQCRVPPVPNHVHSLKSTFPFCSRGSRRGWVGRRGCRQGKGGRLPGGAQVRPAAHMICIAAGPATAFHIHGLAVLGPEGLWDHIVASVDYIGGGTCRCARREGMMCNGTLLGTN